MKIAHILPSLAFAGPVLISKSIVNELSAIIDIDVFFFDDKTETNFKAKTQRINFNEKINFNKYNIIHTHMFRPDLYAFFWSSLGFCRSTIKISTIHQFIDHDLQNQHSAIKARIASKIWHHSFNEFNTLVTLNQPMYELYKHKYPHKNVVKIHNGIEIPLVTEDIPESDKRLILKLKKDFLCLGSAAQITKNKGFAQIIKLLAINKTLCFVLIGEGHELDNLKLLAQENNTLDRVLFFGRRNNAKRYFKYFDIFVMSSEKEGFPVALLEAASLSIPSVCTKNDIFTNIFNQDEVSFFDRDNIDSLNDSVLRIINNRTNYTNNIYNRFIKDYTSKTMAMNYLKLYHSLSENQ
jgi:L-malate glycosyltransferase